MISSVSRAFRDQLLGLLSLGVAMLAWEALPRLGILSPTMLPPFSVAAQRAWELIISGEIGPHVFGSLKRLVIGLAISLILSIPAGIAMGRNERVRNFLDPLLTVMYPIPKAALMPILMLWFGAGDFTKILVQVIGCSIPLVVSAYHSAQGIDKNLIWSAQTMGTKPLQILVRVIFPATLPQTLSGIRQALAISFFVALSSEMIVRQEGLGYYLFNALDMGLYDLMYGTILLVAITGFLIDLLFVVTTQRLLVWMDSNEHVPR